MRFLPTLIAAVVVGLGLTVAALLLGRSPGPADARLVLTLGRCDGAQRAANPAGCTFLDRQPTAARAGQYAFVIVVDATGVTAAAAPSSLRLSRGTTRIVLRPAF
jgi:hypothetical protein